jgi:predicted glycosyltransferase
MKLGYLHPSVFVPDVQIRQKYNLSNQYVIIRLTRLTAYHDFGIRGINYDLVAKIIAIVEAKGFEVKISAEAAIEPRFERYLLKIDTNDMHHVLAQANLLISDSQSMSVEAAMLGVPSIRYSDLAGKISVLEELEHTYELTYGIPAGAEDRLITRLIDLIEQPDLRSIFQKRRHRMLAEKIDVTAFLVWFLKQYPNSLKIMKTNPDCQDIYKS